MITLTPTEAQAVKTRFASDEFIRIQLNGCLIVASEDTPAAEAIEFALMSAGSDEGDITRFIDCTDFSIEDTDALMSDIALGTK